MTEEKYTAEQLEQMADQFLQEAAPAQEKPAKGGLDEKTIASLPAAALLLAAGQLGRVCPCLIPDSQLLQGLHDHLLYVFP